MKNANCQVCILFRDPTALLDSRLMDWINHLSTVDVLGSFIPKKRVFITRDKLHSSTGLLLQIMCSPTMLLKKKRSVIKSAEEGRNRLATTIIGTSSVVAAQSRSQMYNSSELFQLRININEHVISDSEAIHFNFLHLLLCSSDHPVWCSPSLHLSLFHFNSDDKPLGASTLNEN